MVAAKDHAAGYIGQRLKRVEDMPLLTGQGRYGSDLHFPDMVQLAVVRSTQAHARIVRVDTSRATQVPGVIAAFSARDLPDIMKPAPALIRTPGARVATPTPLAVDVVRYVGEAVAVVVAADRYAAEDGADSVEVEYAPLPAVMSVEQDPARTSILHEGWPSNVGEHFVVTAGEGARALERAATVVEVTRELGRVSAQPLEPRAVTAVYDQASESLTIYLETQSVHGARRFIGQALGLPEERVRVVAPAIGGAFGVKNRQYGEEVLAAYLAMRLNRPVKWVGDRREEFVSTNQSRAQVHHARIGLDGEGRVVALVDHFLVDAGAYNVTAGGPAHNTSVTLQGPYRIPNLEITCDVVVTNAVPTGPYRGAGRPEAAYVTERLMDRAADAIGMDRMEIRRRNLLRPEDMPYDTGIQRERGSVQYDSGDYPAGFERVLAEIGYDGFRARQAAERERGVYLGVGVANSIEMSGIGVGETARVHLDASGDVTVVVAVSEMGQGHATPYAQIAAERLGVPVERVRVVQGDTAAIGEGVGTFASRATMAAGNAISGAARQLRRRILDAAAERLEVSADDLVWEGEQIMVRGAPAARMPYWAVVEGNPLEEEASAPGPTTFGFQAHGAIVEVDPQTLEIRVRDYVICHDAGVVVNPLIADGQTIGAAVQGLGNALTESMRYDAAGLPLTTTLRTYLLPTSEDTPEYRIFEQDIPARTNAEGFRGLAEGGTITALPALAQAVEDALAPFGVRLDSLPLTPQRLHEALQRAKMGGGA
jgi:carbon-monoxide dehydrogenase large subunit